MDSVSHLTELTAFVYDLADLAQMRRRKLSLLYLCSLFTLFASPRVLAKLDNQRIILSLRMMDLFKARNKLLTRAFTSHSLASLKRFSLYNTQYLEHQSLK